VTETRAQEQTERQRRDQEAVSRQLEGLVANTMRSIQALEGKLTADEQERILAVIEKAKKAQGQAGMEDLKERLAEMEKAASLIGQAMLRP
jgi:molecular chaperone DnaK (HSP70)